MWDQRLEHPNSSFGLLVLTLAFALGPIACGGPAEESAAAEGSHASPVGRHPTSNDGLDAAPTYYEDIQPMLARRCVRCHREGNIAPFSLEELDQVRSIAPAALHAMESGSMPPWPPSTECRHYANERLISQQEVALFAAWVEAGSPAGERNDVEDGMGLEEPLRSFEPTHIGRPVAAYLPADTTTDDYRCFPLDLVFEEDSYLKASQVVPGAASLVHHVLIYAIAPERSEALDALEAAEPEAGYRCFGGSEVGTPKPIGAWVPGIEPILLEDGLGIFLRAGSRIVMQVHYNTLAAGPEEDLTTWQARFETAPPSELVESRPFAHRSLRVPAGEPASVQIKEFTNRTSDPWEVISVGPHMHLMGVSLRLEVLHQDGEESCLVDIPRWDFNWQQNYDFMPEERVVVNPGDTVRLTCVYDNSARNQPFVDGQFQVPRELRWGDGTLDEMCLAFLTMVTPFDAPKPMCTDFNACATGCGPGEGLECMLRCMGGDTDCALCMIPEVFVGGGCVDVACTEEMEEADECLLNCAARSLGEGGDVNDCMAGQCAEAHARLVDCAISPLRGGLCDSAMTSCNATM